MKGYKLLCKGMDAPYIYSRFSELGVWYETKIKGFEFYEYFIDAIMHCNDVFSNYDIYEVEAEGVNYYDTNTRQYSSSKIKLVKKLEKDDIDALIEYYGTADILDQNVTINLTTHGYGLATLIDDENPKVRAAVAAYGYGLDKLINDKNWIVRREVARYGYGLDILINDEDERVRDEAQKMIDPKESRKVSEGDGDTLMKGYKLLCNNMEAPFMKNFHYELDKWYEVEDDSKVDAYTYGFHFFKDLNDLIEELSYATVEEELDIYEVEAKGIISNNNYFVEIYCSSKIRVVRKLEKEEIDDFLTQLVVGFNSNIGNRGRKNLIRRGLGLEIFINDSYTEVRAEVARNGYGLDKLVNDTSWMVRATVARQGYDLDVLINDSDEYVRAIVAEQKYGLDILVNDYHPFVRAAVARHGYGLDILVHDEEPIVRMAVAKAGYWKQLIDDEDEDVQEAVKECMKMHFNSK